MCDGRREAAEEPEQHTQTTAAADQSGQMSAPSSPNGKPGFLQPAFEPGPSNGEFTPRGSPASSAAGGASGYSGSAPSGKPQRPPRPEQFSSSGGSFSSATRVAPPGPSPTPPTMPMSPAHGSSRGSSPRRRLVAASQSPVPSVGAAPGTPRGGCSPVPCSSNSSGSRPVTSLAGSSNLTGLLGEPGSIAPSQRQEMLQKGYLPAEDYFGIMALNKEYRAQHVKLRAELVNIKVENERLRMEETFLRDSVRQAGLDAPAEVPVTCIHSAASASSTSPLPDVKED